MKAETASLLIVVALLVGAAIGFVGGGLVSSGGSYTTVTSTSTEMVHGASGDELCVVVDYQVLAVATTHPANGTLTYGNETVSNTLTSFLTTGLPSYTTTARGGTTTGGYAYYNATTCYTLP